MYHIKNDKRAITSSNLIYTALIQCLKKKPFDKITITDIQVTSSVGRATFYRNFDNLIDVLKWKCNQSFEELLTLHIKKYNEDSKQQLLLDFFEYWFHHSDILELLLSINHQDVIYNSFVNNSHIITNYYKEKLSLPIQNYDYYIAIRIGIFIAILITWLNNEKKETPNEVINIISEQLDFLNQSEILL